MRVYLYARDFPPAGDQFAGGLNKAVHGLAGGFVQSGVQATVLCSGTTSSRVYADSGYEILCFERGLSQRLGLALSEDLRRFIDSCDESDIFLLNGVFNPDNFLVSQQCLRNNLTYFCWPHDPFSRSLFAKKGYLKWPYWLLRDRPMLRKAKAVQVFDASHEDWLRGLGVKTPTVVIDNGIDPMDAIAESELQWNEAGPPKLIYLGRIDYYNKALDVLLDAFADIAQLNDATLTLQGPDNGDLQMLKARAEALGLEEPRVQFKNPRFDRTATAILNEHDVLMLPSRFEGFGLAALEAMVAGRVLLLSDVSGLAKHVRAAGCGVVVKPDKESIEEGFARLMDERPRWKAMGMAGREYALAHFRWERIAAELVDCYQQHSLAPFSRD